MNSEILKYYQDAVAEDMAYLNEVTVRASLESYKEDLERETAKLEDESWRIMNTSFLNSFYPECISVIEENEAELNSKMSTFILELKKIANTSMVEPICEQLGHSMEDFALRADYESFNGLFFEYGSSPSFAGFAFKEPEFEVILQEPKYIKFEDGGYAADDSIDFELKELFENIIGEEFEEIAWKFEFELDIFKRMQNAVTNIVALNLHKALQSPHIKQKLNEIGFEKNGVVYINEHDMEPKSVFVNE